MTARRSLTPAARGVSLAVLAALRAGRVDLADQADGSTLATSTAPDGTELLRATLRMPVRGAADPRQLTLGAVSLTPQPAEVPPARNVPVPEADDLAVYGERSIVAIIHEGGPWELVWSDALPGHMSYETAVSATTAQAHRVRVYHRGKRCTRDSRDGAK